MSNVIVFYLLNTTSHYNSTLRVAETLKQSNMRVVYAGEKRFEKYVLDHGFEFFFHSDQDLFAATLDKPENSFIGRKINEIRQWNRYHKNFAELTLFDDLITKLQPTLILLDTCYIYFAPALLKRSIKFMILTSTVNPDYTTSAPPFNSFYIPKSHKVDQFYIILLWKYLFFRKKLFNFYLHYFQLSCPSFYSLKRSLKSLKNDDRLLLTRRVSHPIITNTPELILSDKAFDFPRSHHRTQIHLGNVVDSQRANPSQKMPIDILTTVALFKSQKKKIIFCSLGSYDRVNRKRRARFFQTLINTIIQQEEWVLILFIGEDLEVESLSVGCDRVMVYNRMLPQIDILRISDIFITHGGLLSVTEAVLIEVPMVVFPLNLKSDQVGNAARVEFHSLGLRCNMKNAKSPYIVRHINLIIDKYSLFKKKLNLMKQEYSKTENFNSGIKSIIKYANEH